MSSPNQEVSHSMLTETSTPAPNANGTAEPPGPARTLMGRITRVEIMVAAVIAAVMVVLVLIEPNILEAPFQNGRTLLFTFGGTALAAAAFVGMLWFRVPPVVRVVVLVVPFVIVNWWLLSPYFIDDVVDESFSTSIAEQVVAVDEAPVPAAAEQETAPVPTASATPAPAAASETVAAIDDAPLPITVAPDSAPAASDTGPTPAGDAAPPAPTPAPEPTVATPAPAEAPAVTTPPPPTGPVLLGAGRFVGLAGHSGTGDAGIFQSPDGSLVLRFENFDIENGPDLEVYLVPGADQTSLADGSIHLGALKGNVGDQNYELAGTDLAPGTYTALVWCEAFSVEFVGATITI